MLKFFNNIKNNEKLLNFLLNNKKGPSAIVDNKDSATMEFLSNEFKISLKSTITELKCSCGGLLTIPSIINNIYNLAMIMVGKLPHHNRSRIQKKWRKRWLQKLYPAVNIGMIWELAKMPKYFICQKCGLYSGFYSAMVNNMFPIQQMPPGALSIYSKDPNDE